MGLDQLRAARIELDLLAQPADLVVDAAVEDRGLAPAGQVEQLVAGQDHAGALHQDREQEELAGAERYGHPVLANQLAPADPPIVPDVRVASVTNLARQHGVDLVHAEHIAELADQLVAALPGAGLPAPGEPELVDAAALLHDVGMAVDYDDHHKHSSYLILGSGLPGFTPREVALIALMARYHCKGTPSLGSAAALCEPGDDELLLRGAALLRIAEQLERNRDQVVRGARLRRGPGDDDGVVLELDADGDTVVAEWGAERQGDLFARAFGAPLTVARS